MKLTRLIAGAFALVSVGAFAQDLRIAGVVDGPLPGGLPKAIEIEAVNVIADLSRCGVGAANNGGGTDGQEFTFPNVALAAGDVVFVATEATNFNAFFGFDPTYTSTNAASINGDDAVELFCDGVVIDTFGEIDIDGTSQPWEYTDGWAKRIGTTGPDGPVFVFANWTFSGPNALDGATSNATASVPYPLSATPPPPPTPSGALVINEFLADPAADLSGDANNDGVRDSSEDEFIELVNVSGADLDLSGWVINDAVGLRHAFPAGTTVADGCAIVVFGGSTPVGDFGGSVVQTASTGFLGLNNGGDSIELLDGSAALIATASYGSEGGDNQSLTRDPDLSGGLAPHAGASGAAGALFSPGTLIDGTRFSGCSAAAPTLSIPAVQGSGRTSPEVGNTVTVNGIVTGDFQDADADMTRNLRGFYIQDAAGDGNAATSDGLFVFEFSPIVDVNVGDAVSVTGTVAEFFGETQISASSVVITGSGSITPTVVTLPAAAAVLNADDEFIADLEFVEGMLVELAGPLSVTEMFNLDRFGEMRLAQGGHLFQFTNENAPSVAGFAAHLENIATLNVFLDDGLTAQNPDPIRYPTPDGLPNATGAAVRMDDLVSNLIGNVRFSRGSGGSGDEAYRLMPTVDPVFTPNNLRPAVPNPVGGSLTVASFNVLNYFTTIDTGEDICGPAGTLGCRGADSELELTRQTDKIVTALLGLDADIVGLIELENNVSQSLQDLVAAINAAAGGAVYDFVDTGTIGGDAIKNGFIYKPSTVQLAGPFAILDSTVDPTFIDTKNRPVLAQTFVELASGEAVTVAVNHLKSKDSACDDVGDPNANDGQGNCNGTRTSAAVAMANWLAAGPTGSGDPDVLIIGDLNAYLLEDPISALEDAGYENLLKTFIGPRAYGFVFDGQAGVLDHALANAALAPQVTGVTEWHINADEADAIDYNLNFGRNPAIFDGTIAFRASDHDPVLVGLDLNTRLLGDIDGDGDIDRRDFRLLVRAIWVYLLRGTYTPAADLNDDGAVNLVDLAIFFTEQLRFVSAKY
ncbi:MAG: ExeM/NucH family extracellular endonuclease [Pseudomonadota bacterium]